jgi:hypothetical protein
MDHGCQNQVIQALAQEVLYSRSEVMVRTSPRGAYSHQAFQHRHKEEASMYLYVDEAIAS